MRKEHFLLLVVFLLLTVCTTTVHGLNVSLERTLSHDSDVNAVAFNHDGTILATATDADNYSVKLWDVQSGQLIRTLTGHTSYIWDIEFDPTGAVIATASGDNSIKIWTTSTGQLASTFEGHSSTVFTLAFNPDGS
ncbi:MAG: hypothetical protein P9M15_08010, partial [Candidatus Electryoneaceae bacterium]|nr:hypothetical protein [Candidatus Electryoneaceae bacterium]